LADLLVVVKVTLAEAAVAVGELIEALAGVPSPCSSPAVRPPHPLQGDVLLVVLMAVLLAAELGAEWPDDTIGLLVLAVVELLRSPSRP
jgi:hypothetical protein